MIKHKGKNYVDSTGKYFRYTKSIKGDLICHKIRKTESRDIGTVVWLEDIPSAFTEKRPLPAEMRYARVLYLVVKVLFLYTTIVQIRKEKHGENIGAESVGRASALHARVGGSNLSSTI